MTDEEITSTAINHLWRLNLDLSIYPEEDRARIKKEIKRIEDDRANIAYDRRKDDGVYNGRFGI